MDMAPPHDEVSKGLHALFLEGLHDIHGDVAVHEVLGGLLALEEIGKVVHRDSLRELGEETGGDDPEIRDALLDLLDTLTVVAQGRGPHGLEGQLPARLLCKELRKLLAGLGKGHRRLSRMAEDELLGIGSLGKGERQHDERENQSETLHLLHFLL